MATQKQRSAVRKNIQEGCKRRQKETHHRKSSQSNAHRPRQTGR